MKKFLYLLAFPFFFFLCGCGDQEVARLVTKDLDGIRQAGFLRILMQRNSYDQESAPLNDSPLNNERSLAVGLAVSLGLEPVIVYVDDFKELIPALLEGRGDLIVANMTITADRKKLIAFTEPLAHASEQLVTRAGDDEVRSVADLNGKVIAVPEATTFLETLLALKKFYPGIRAQILPASLTTDEILELLADKKIDLTIDDSNVLSSALKGRDDLKNTLKLSEDRSLAWGVRTNNLLLLKAVNDFLLKELGCSAAVEKLRNNWRRSVTSFSSSENKKYPRVSPYDPWVRLYADRYGFEWLLIVSQMYQESRFRTYAVSPSGARGLLQVMPKTASRCGFKRNLQDPATGIHAGVKYLNYLRNYYESDVLKSDCLLFALAAYNAGMGHVDDARKLARRMGWNPNRWFGHTEKAMLLLSKPGYARQSDHGYVNGRQTVKYVRAVNERYKAYSAEFVN